MAVDYEGTEGGSRCVLDYATLMIMHNNYIKFHVITCAPNGERNLSPTGPEWFIELLQLAGVAFVFSDKEAAALHARGRLSGRSGWERG